MYVLSPKGKRLVLRSMAAIVPSFTMAVIIYAVLFGPLFPWSPIKIGYDTQGFSRATLFFPKNTPLPCECREIDRLMKETEEFHKLKYSQNVVVFFPRTKKQYKRYTFHTAGACALKTGTAIYISPLMKETGRDVVGILKHELSHAILYQNTTYLKAREIKNWLEEGLAVFYGNPHDYYEGEQFLEVAVDSGYFFNVLDYEEKTERIPEEYRYKFMYAEFRFFTEYVIDKYGYDLLLDYVKKHIKEPDMEKELFYQVFDIELKDVVRNFQNDVMGRKWPELASEEGE